MARGINKAILIGNLGADPETRYTANGSVITNIRIATTDQWRDRQSGELQERTEWHRVVFFGRLAEVAAEHMRKGSQCYIEGRIQTRKWQTQDGQDRYSTEIIASEFQFLGGRPSSGWPPATDHGAGAAHGMPQEEVEGGLAPAPPEQASSNPPAEPHQRQSQPPSQPQPRAATGAPPFDDDDIPF